MKENIYLKILYKYKVLFILLLIMPLPMFLKGYPIRFFTTIFMYIALAQAWNIIGGFTGYISLGITGLVGLGAYLTAVFMTHQGLSFYVAAILSALITMLFSLIISGPILRLKSGYFAIATFAVAYILREVANNLTTITGGGMGIVLPMRGGSIDQSNSYFFYLMLAIAILATLTCYFISKSRLGYGLWSIKEDEDAANVLGINTRLYKVIAFGISSLFAGLIGSAYAYWLVFIEPISVFDQAMSIMVISMVLVGGAGTVYGPIIGTVFVTALSEFFWNKFLNLHQGILGVLLILIILFLPRGIIAIFKQDFKGAKVKDVLKKYYQDLKGYKI